MCMPMDRFHDMRSMHTDTPEVGNPTQKTSSICGHVNGHAQAITPHGHVHNWCSRMAGMRWEV
jgi:hypothetical protein